MKLTSTQIERTIGQFEAQAIPEDHPVVPQLNDLFGEHTFFLDRWTQYLGAGRGQSGRGAVGQGRESCELERRRFECPGTSRA